MTGISPKRYVQGFCLAVIALAAARLADPSIAYSASERAAADSLAAAKSLLAHDTLAADTAAKGRQRAEGGPFVPHRIYSVPDFDRCFPDANDVQLVAAQRFGVKPPTSREEAEKLKDGLVYAGSNPYFHVDRARNSIPYLTPAATILLQDIGASFFDSLQIKGIPLHKVIVTSVLRTREDVARLQRHNPNASPNSCHQYATTFDICYNRYKTVEDPDGEPRREVTNDTLKWVLSEVLRDIRQQGRCYIKYEKKQSCFHITVRE